MLMGRRGCGVRQVRGALSGRKRRPNVSQDFPLVICAELEAVEEAKQRLVKCLQAVTGVAPPQAPVSHRKMYTHTRTGPRNHT